VGPGPWEFLKAHADADADAIEAYLHLGMSVLRTIVGAIAAHTGVPAVLVATLLLYGGYRAFRRSVRFLVQVALVAAALSLAAKFGWLRW
jgi:hypothetical protein